MIPKAIRILSQVLLIIIAIPILMLVISFFSPSTAIELLEEIWESIPLFDTWLDVLSMHESFGLTRLVDIYVSSFFEAIILGICMMVCDKIAKLLHVTKVIPFGKTIITFVGLIVGFFLVKILKPEQGLSLIAVGLIMVCGIIYMLKAVLPISGLLSWIDFLLIILDGLVAVVLTGYIAALYLFTGGAIGLATLLSLLVIAIIALVLMYVVSGE